MSCQRIFSGKMCETKYCKEIYEGDSRNGGYSVTDGNGLVNRHCEDKMSNIDIILFLYGPACFFSFWSKSFWENSILSHCDISFSKYRWIKICSEKGNVIVLVCRVCHEEFKQPEYQQPLIHVPLHVKEIYSNYEHVTKKPDFCDQSTQTADELQGKLIVLLKQQLEEKDKLINKLEKQTKRIFEEKLSLEKERQKWKAKFQRMENDYRDILLEFGQLSVENDSNIYKTKESEKFQKIFPPKSSASLVASTEGNMSPPFYSKSIITSDAQRHPAQTKAAAKPVLTQSPSEPRERTVSAGAGFADFTPCPEDHYQSDRDQNSLNATYESNFLSENIPFSVQVEDRSNVEPISLISKPSCSIAVRVYSAYKLLILTISNFLLSSDIIKIRKWANEKFEVENNCSLTDMFSQLDQKGAINAFDLSQLRTFFESTGRCDLVHLIDEFSGGDYDKLKKMISENFQRNSSREYAGNQVQVASSRVRLPQNGNSLRAAAVEQGISNAGRLERQTSAPQNDEITIASNHARITNVCSDLPSISSSNATGNRYSTRKNSEIAPDGSAVNNTRENASDEQIMSACCDTPMKKGNMKGKKMSPSRQQSSPNSATQSSGPAQHRPCNYHPTSSHGMKQDKWLCNHYKRKCMVKFECCNKYWPCHRCHNEQSTCGRRKLKSRDTTMIKCVECGKEQKFGQFCVSCNTQFSTFYCGLCKHLTGNDDHPYHCDKCGICRIHGDRSYHCDVCGICLDVQLRGNHKCRPNSAHDECCICLEDAFTGCQILPCSHKVHKECATRMIRSGITRCPVCRESFAHKLERRPIRK